MPMPMQTIVICFDVDGTLRDNTVPTMAPLQVNEPIRQLLIALSQLQNTHIVVWSARGQQYATEMAHRLCVQQYVDRYAAKGTMQPHIAVDDLAYFSGGAINLVV